MNLLTGATPVLLWKETIDFAEKQSQIVLEDNLRAYLVHLLMRYTNQPQLAKQVFATTLLEALQERATKRQLSLQILGDQCLLFAGLFPQQAQRKCVKISYFVDMGRAAYGNISKQANDLYWSLAFKFVGLMDVLQSIRAQHGLTPLDAYELWDELGSKRALRILREYTKDDCVHPLSSLK